MSIFAEWSPASYHDFFGACATVAGALIGLLFVAISISPAKLSGPRAERDHQLKAAMAFSALVNTLVIALVALLPGASLSLTVIVVAAAGLSSTAGLIILLLRDTRLRVRLNQLILPAVLLALYSLQLAGGVELGGKPGNPGLLGNLGDCALASSTSPSRGPGRWWARATPASSPPWWRWRAGPGPGRRPRWAHR